VLIISVAICATQRALLFSHHILNSFDNNNKLHSCPCCMYCDGL